MAGDKPRRVRPVRRNLMNSMKTQSSPQRGLSAMSGAQFRSAEREFQQDSDHPSKNPNKPISDVQFTHSCKPSLSTRKLAEFSRSEEINKGE
jgi:hypothetical protein